MAETTGVAELIVRVRDEATKQMQALAKVLQQTLDPEQWEEVKDAMEDLGVEVEDLTDGFEDFNEESDKTNKQTDKTRKKMDKFADSLDDVGDAADALGGNIGGVTGNVTNLLAVLGRVNPVLAGVAAVMVTTFAGFKAANDVGNYAKELKNLAVIANTSTQDLQRFAAGAERVGFDLNESAEVLQDFNDRIGDMLSGAGGSLQDYFDALGDSVSYTARELQEMSTLDALQAVQNDLEKSNLPLEQQIFLWESISGRASRLLPIIRDNGKLMREFADAAEDRGAILSDKEIADAARFNKAMTDLGKSFETLWRRVGVTVLPVLEGFVELVDDVSEGIDKINRFLRDGVIEWDDWKESIVDVNNFLANFSTTALTVDKVRESIEGVNDETGNITDEGVRRLTQGYQSAADTLDDIRTKLTNMRQAEALITQRLEQSNLSRAKQQQLQDNLAEAQQAITDLTSQEQLATEKVLQAKLALETAQKNYNKAVEEGSDLQKLLNEIDNAAGGQNGLVLQELLDGYKAQLAEFYTDTGKTLEARLGAAANATFLNYKSVLTRIKQLGGDTSIVGSVINQETARKQFDILSTEFDRVSEDVELRAAKLGRQVANGIITEATAFEELQRIYGDTGESLEGLLERMEALAAQTGSQDLAQQVEVLRNAVETFKDDLGTEGFIRPEWLDSLKATRERIQDIKNELNLEGVELTGLDTAMEAAIEGATRPLRELKEKIQDELTGIELEEANLAIDEAIDVAAVEAKLDVLEGVFTTRVEAFNAILEGINLEQEQGLITEVEAAEKVKQAYASLRPEIASVVEEMNTLADESGSQVLKTRVKDLENSFTSLDLTVAETTASMVENMLEAGAEAAGSGFAQAITDIATEAKSLGDAFKDVMKGILQSMLEVVQSVVAKQFANLILGAVAGGAGGAAGGGALAFADGGYVRGKGTTKSDSIRAWLSDKEFVQPADATAYYGVQFMEMLRRKMIPRELLASLMGGTRSMPVHKPRTPRFNSGGFVSGDVLNSPDGGAQGTDLSVTLVQVKDENEAASYIQSRRGSGDIIQVLEKNKTKVKSILNGNT